MNKTRILIVDDESEIRDIVRVLLEREGFEIVQAIDGKQAIERLDGNISLVIMDIMMPGNSGYEVCELMRRKYTVPILFLTAKTKDSDLEKGFLSGGDDYLAKPFSSVELVARVKGLLRRYYVYKGKTKELDIIKIENISIDEESQTVRKNEDEIILTNIEYGILLFLAKSKNKVVSAKEIYETVWEEQFFSSSNNTVMVHIRKLREKIEENPHEPKMIKTVWGKGYRFG